MVSIVWQALTQDTRLSKGNPNHPNLKADFSRLKVDVREPALVRAGPTQAGDTKILDNEIIGGARNSIGHGQDRMRTLVVGDPPTAVSMERVAEWVSTLDRLATSLDTVVAAQLAESIGARPW